MMHFDGNLMLTFGLLIAAALGAGMIAGLLSLPRVTAYLLVGLALGPRALSIADAEDLEQLHPLSDLAMALVLFQVGCQLPLVHFRRIAARAFRLSGAEIALTLVLVVGGLAILGQPWSFALLMGALAVATAPATTLLVLQETRSEGPVTQLSIYLVVLNNFFAIVAFETIFVCIRFAAGKLESELHHELSMFALLLFGSVAVGILAGVATSYLCSLLLPSRWLVVLVAITTAVLGICTLLELRYTLAFLALGITVANTSDRTREIIDELSRFTGLICVVFFVVHGADLDIKAFLAIGSIGAAYIVLRSTGKYFGIFAAARPHEDGLPVRRWLGATILSQAGVAIALSSMAATRDPELGGPIKNLVLGTVVFFEIVGPLLIRYGVLHAGEVPLAQAIRHTTTTPLDALQAISHRLLVSIGFDPLRGRTADELTVAKLMRTNVQGIDAAANFDEIIDAIEHSHDNTFPVVEEGDVLVGVIPYVDLRDVLFDPALQHLVRAADLAVGPRQTFHPDQTLSEAWRWFRTSKDDCIPVITRDSPGRLLGVLRRRDLLRLVRDQGTADFGAPKQA